MIYIYKYTMNVTYKMITNEHIFKAFTKHIVTMRAVKSCLFVLQ